MCKSYSKQTEVIFHLCFFFIVKNRAKRNFNNCFVQIFYCLHKRVLQCRGGVSPPAPPALSIHNPANSPVSATPANAYAFAYPPRLGDACKRLRICISPPSRRRLQTLTHLHIPPVSATPANACAFANPPRLGDACLACSANRQIPQIKNVYNSLNFHLRIEMLRNLL